MGLSNFVIKYRWYIIIVTLVLVLLGIIPLTKIRVNPDLESYLPQTMPSIQNNKKIGEYFGNDELLLIIFQTEDVLNEKTLNRIRKITDTLSIMPQFGRVYSLFQGKDIRSEEGSMVVDPVVQRIPDNEDDREALRDAIRKNDLVYKVVVSEDFKYALIILSSDKTVNDDHLMQLIHETLQKYPGDEEIYINGSPFLRDEASKKIGRDIMLLLPIGLLVMFLILYFSFRELRSVLLPFFVVLFSIVISMALIPVFGWEFSLIGVIIPVMMLAIANNYGVYYAARYQDLRASQPDLEASELAKQVSGYLVTPVTLCGLTTIVGILGLVAHLFRPARQMGIVSAIGISFALLVSLLFIPAVLSLLKKGRIHKDLQDGSKGFIPSLTERAGEGITRHPKRIVGIFILFMAFCSAGLFFFKTAPDSNDVLPQSHSFNKAINIMDNSFGGSKMFNVMFQGDVKDPALLACLDKYEQELKKVPGVGTVTSLSSIIRKISKTLNDSTDAGAPAY